MADLRIYRAPSGLCFQFPEGEQPEGYVEVGAKPKAAPKRRRATNKAKQADNK